MRFSAGIPESRRAFTSSSIPASSRACRRSVIRLRLVSRGMSMQIMCVSMCLAFCLVGSRCLVGVEPVIFAYFNGSYGTLDRIDIGGIVELLHVCEHTGQLFEAFAMQPFSQIRIFRNVRQDYS